MNGKWQLEKTITLLTLDQLQTIKKTAPYTVLISITGRLCYAGNANEDIRGGFVGYSIADWY